MAVTDLSHQHRMIQMWLQSLGAPVLVERGMLFKGHIARRLVPRQEKPSGNVNRPAQRRI